MGKFLILKQKKPISSREGYIGYSLNDDTSIKTDEHGRFKITPKTESYYFFRPNLKNYPLVPHKFILILKGI